MPPNPKPPLESFAPMIIVAISMILTHFFNDSDRHRSFCEKLRAKYLMCGKGPLDYKMMTQSPIKGGEPELHEDFLMARLVEIHFGVITIITVFGLIVAGLIVYYSIGYFAPNGYWPQLFWVILIFIMIISVSYLAQQGVTAKRLNELHGTKLGRDMSYFQQGYLMLEGKIKKPNKLHYFFSIVVIFVYMLLLDVWKRLANYWLKLTALAARIR